MCDKSGFNSQPSHSLACVLNLFDHHFPKIYKIRASSYFAGLLKEL